MQAFVRQNTWLECCRQTVVFCDVNSQRDDDTILEQQPDEAEHYDDSVRGLQARHQQYRTYNESTLTSLLLVALSTGARVFVGVCVRVRAQISCSGRISSCLIHNLLPTDYLLVMTGHRWSILLKVN